MGDAVGVEGGDGGVGGEEWWEDAWGVSSIVVCEMALLFGASGVR